MRSLFLRALLEGLLERQFGNDMMDELFDRYSEKITCSRKVQIVYNISCFSDFFLGLPQFVVWLPKKLRK